MKISILSAFHPFRGGIAQFSESLAHALESDHEVDTFTFTTQYPALLFPGKSQYVANLNETGHSNARRVLNSVNPLSWIRTANKIGEKPPDLLLTRLWMPFMAPCMGTVSRFMPKTSKTIGIVDNAIPHESRWMDKALTRYYIRHHKGFIALSESVSGDLQEIAGRALDVKVLKHPIYDHFGVKMDEKEARDILGVPAGARVLLFFGLIREYKGLDRLIESFQQLNDDYYLVIAGECYEDESKYLRQIESHPSSSRIHFHNRFIPDHEVSRFFSAADVCVLPYKSATQSGITAMSYHFDLPVISTNVGGLSEFIEHGKTGYLVDYQSPSDFVQAIDQFFKDRDSVDFKHAIENFRQQNSWSSFADGMVEFARGLL